MWHLSTLNISFLCDRGYIKHPVAKEAMGEDDED
jgi:hypothetical protein